MPAANYAPEGEGESSAGGGTMGLFGVTMNAMALIAPGAFLWITFQLQVQTGYRDMWFGIAFALVVAFSTAFPYAELARKYPDAGCGGAYNFTKSSFSDSSSEGFKKKARMAKLIVGWSSHLFYWVYPGVMVGFMATLLDYIFSCDAGAGTCSGGAVPVPVLSLFCLVLAMMIGKIAYGGAEGSTSVSIAINAIQLTMLVFFSCLCFAFRGKGEVGGIALKDVTQLPTLVEDFGEGFPNFNQDVSVVDWATSNVTTFTQEVSEVWSFEEVGMVLSPYSIDGMLLQSSVAILILVGFDSATSLGGECKNAKRDVPRGVILSIAIQGLFAYFFEYWAANAAMTQAGPYAFQCGDDCEPLDEDHKGRILYGMDAAAMSSAPIGDLAILVGDEMLGSGGGFALMVVMALSTLLACVGSTLAAMNTAVRFSQAMSQDDEFPTMFGQEHPKHGTPYKGIFVQVTWSWIVGTVSACVPGGALAVTLASNIGTFALYLMVCIVCFVSFQTDSNRSMLMHVVVPFIGGCLNILMLLVIFIVGLVDDSTRSAVTIALALAIAWTALTSYYWATKATAGASSTTKVAPAPSEKNTSDA